MINEIGIKSTNVSGEHGKLFAGKKEPAEDAGMVLADSFAKGEDLSENTSKIDRLAIEKQKNIEEYDKKLNVKNTVLKIAGLGFFGAAGIFAAITVGSLCGVGIAAAAATPELAGYLGLTMIGSAVTAGIADSWSIGRNPNPNTDSGYIPPGDSIYDGGTYGSWVGD